MLIKFIKYLIFFCLFSFIIQESYGKDISQKSFESKIDSYDVNTKEKLILKAVATALIKKNNDYIKKVSRFKRKNKKNCKRPLFLEISETEDLNDFKCFEIFFIDTGLSERFLPTYLIKKKDLYITMYLKNQKSLQKVQIPDVLFEEGSGSFKNEDNWIVLICKDTYKFIIVNNGLVPYKATKQFQDFSCEKTEKVRNKIQIEEAIIDDNLLNHMIKDMHTK